MALTSCRRTSTNVHAPSRARAASCERGERQPPRNHAPGLSLPTNSTPAAPTTRRKPASRKPRPRRARHAFGARLAPPEPAQLRHRGPLLERGAPRPPRTERHAQTHAQRDQDQDATPSRAATCRGSRQSAFGLAQTPGPGNSSRTRHRTGAGEPSNSRQNAARPAASTAAARCVHHRPGALTAGRETPAGRQRLSRAGRPCGAPGPRKPGSTLGASAAPRPGAASY